MSGVNPTSMPNTPVSTQDGASLRVNMCAAINAMARTGFSFAPYAQATPDMTVGVFAGALRTGTTLTEVAVQTTGAITPPTVHPRFDRVVIDSITGAVSVITGTEASSPSVPALPDGKLSVCRVALVVGQTSITNANLTDERVGGGGVSIGSLASPSAYAAASTLDVAAAIAAIPTPDQKARNLAMRNALKLGILAGDASGAIPSGYLHLFATDELATKTNANYDANHLYNNLASTQCGTTPASRASAWGQATLIDLNYSLVSGQLTKSYFYTSTAGITIKAKVFRLVSGSTYSLVAESQTQTTVAGLNTIVWNTPPTVQAGDRHGFYISSTAANVYDSGGSAAQIINSDVTTTQAFSTYSYTPATAALVLSGATNMTLIPAAITAGTKPNTVDVEFLHKAVDSVTLGTDLTLRVSTDGGTNWSSYATLEDLGQYDANYKLLHAKVDTSALSGTSVKWEIATHNLKSQQVRAVGDLFSA